MSDKCNLKAVARGPLKASLLTRGSVYGWTATLMMICWMKATGLVSAHL